MNNGYNSRRQARDTLEEVVGGQRPPDRAEEAYPVSTALQKPSSGQPQPTPGAGIMPTR